jgi:putative copper resistance protein D
MQDVLSVALRALSFVFLLQAAGVAFFVAIFGRRLGDSRGTIRRLGRWTALLALLCATGHYALEAARMAGELSSMWDASLQRIVLSSSNGAAFILRVLGLSVVAVALRGESARSMIASVSGATIVLSAFIVTGHTTTHPERWFLGALLLVHVAVIAFWFGGLLPLYWVSVRERQAAAAALIESFSVWASWLVPLILLAGVVLALRLVPGIEVFTQPYGELLLVKLGGFALLMGLASLNKWRLGPSIARGERSALTAFRWSVATEYTLIVGVLTTTAVMTTFFSPDA